MRNALFVLAVLALAVVACGGGPPPTPVTVYVPVTVTPRPPTPLPLVKSHDGYPGVAGSHVRAVTALGWHEEHPQECSSGDCAAILDWDGCSYLMLYFDPNTGVEDGFAYGIDFSDDCPADGGELADRQDDALTTIDAYAAGLWIGEKSATKELPDGPGEVEGACGQNGRWVCKFSMDEDLFGILNVWYR